MTATTATAPVRIYTDAEDAKVADLMEALNAAMENLYPDERMNDVAFITFTQDAFMAGDDFDAAEMKIVQDHLQATTNEDADGPMNYHPEAMRLVRIIKDLNIYTANAFTVAHREAVAFLER